MSVRGVFVCKIMASSLSNEMDSADDVEIIDGFHGGAYAAPTDAAFEAIHLVAQTEAVILDPNYTGKSMSALIARIRSGGFAEDDTVLFLHSGGLPQVFAFNEELAAWSPTSND